MDNLKLKIKVACSLRVPVDVIKQRTQAQSHQTTFQILKVLIRTEVKIKKFTQLIDD